MLRTNTTIRTLSCHRLNENELSHSMKNTLARNKDGHAALEHAVEVKHSQATELLLEKHHANLTIEKDLAVGIWNTVSQNNLKETTVTILVDLCPKLLPHLDKSTVAQLLTNLNEAALAQLLPHLDDADLAQLRNDSRPAIKTVAEMALTSVDPSFDPSRLAQQLTALLALPTDMFAGDGTPLPSIFLERASMSISKRLIDLAAAAVRCFVER